LNSSPQALVAQENWELWNLQALQPGAKREDLQDLKRKRRQLQAVEQTALTDLVSGQREILKPGHKFLKLHPALASGLILTLHLGPYLLLPEPFLAAGLKPAVLLNQAAYRRLQPQAELLLGRLRLPVGLEWIPMDSPYFVRRMLKVLRQQRPLLVFLDGNAGVGGIEQTREKGMLFQLPGREIRVRTGLGRLIGKVGCPVHRVLVRWRNSGEINWSLGLQPAWPNTRDAAEWTRRFFDWGFSEILATPEQWNFWDMLKESYACFSRCQLTAPALPPAVRGDLRRAFEICLSRSPETVRLVLAKEIQIWPGDILANVTDDCFFSAAGLQEQHLELLRGGKPSLADLVRDLGRTWVRFHALRLCLLDLAHLQGS
jgi:hypothetical protein